MALFGNKKTSQTPPKAGVKDKTTTKTSPKEVKKAAASMQDLYTTDTTPVKKSTEHTTVGAKVVAATRILISPLITEKATNLSAENKYIFIVSDKANKIEIAKAIEALYQVKPLKVNLINVLGKKVVRGKIKGQRSSWRKAIITLAKGETIKIYEGV